MRDDPVFSVAFSILTRIVDQIENRNPYSHGHSGRVADLSFAVGKRLGMVDEDLDLIQVAGYAHDIGMILCPDEVLWQPGPLGVAGREMLKRHVEAGAQIVSGIPVLAPAADWIRTHHERWDGQGYPRGLTGNEIPSGGQVLAICEAFVGMTSDRPHRRAMQRPDALRIVHRDVGHAFGPEIASALFTVVGLP